MGGAIRAIVRLIAQYMKFAAAQKVVESVVSSSKELLSVRAIDIPGEFVIEDIFAQLSSGTDGFGIVDVDFTQKNICKNLKSPSAGKYKLILFNGSIGIVKALLVARLKLWKFSSVWPANIDEVASVGNSCDFKALGLGMNYNLIASGTIMRRSTATLPICYPSVNFIIGGSAGCFVRTKDLALRSVFDPCPAGFYLLFRVS